MTTNVSPKIAQQLMVKLEQDLALASQLKTLLQAEKERLEQRQFPAYQLVLKDKTQLLVQLDQADNERKHLMASMGFSADRQGFVAFLAFVPASWKEKFQTVWESLADVMNTCARLNKINGKILAHTQSATERLMLIFRGANNQPSIYQANGRHSVGASPRVLATA